jgi:hypothetical protein
MRKRLRTSVKLALVVAMLALGGAGTGSAQAADVKNALDCAATTPSSPCVRYCYVIPEQPNSGRYPCGVGNQPRLTGVYTYSVPMSAATQSATGIAGDPGATGTANITLDLTNNRFCATTSWSGIDSKVVAGHIHEGGYGEPENPGVWIALMTPDFLNGVRSPVSYCETAPAGELWLIKQCPSKFHTVVHSQNHPAGAIRGQIGTGCTL